MPISITSVISSVKESVSLVRKAQAIANDLKNVELKSTIAELANKLADANMQLAELKDELRRVKEDKASLDAKDRAEKPTMKWGCYVFDGDDRLFCPACFDTKGKKHVTTRMNSKQRRCSVCQAVLGS